LDASSGKTRLPKTRRVPEAFSGRELTERSLKIIETIGRYRFLSSSKVIRLVGGNEDVTHRHLQQLFHLGLISRLKIPSAPANSEFIYFLENAALLRNVAHDARINAECLNFEEIRLNRDKYGGEHTTNGRQRTGQMLFIEHELMISDFHAALESETSLSKGRVGLDVWQQGNKTWATVPAKRDSAALPHRPDAYFMLNFPIAPDGQQHSHFFYEADRNTTSRTRFKLKLVAYVQFFLQGLYAEKYGARKVRAVLTETTSGARMKLLKETAAELAEREPLAAPLFWFTTSGLVREKGIFSALWECTADSRLRSLLD
jgi:hypothetical protein